MTPERVKSIIESIIFVSSEPVNITRLENSLPETDRTTISGAITALIEEYRKNDRGFHLTEVSGGYQFRTNSENKPWLEDHIKQITPLSNAAVETLAVIAYRQPVIRSEIEYIRGVDSGGPLRRLLELNLIKIAGRKKIAGRPLIYKTTPHFLEFFQLRSLEELPELKELDEKASFKK